MYAVDRAEMKTIDKVTVEQWLIPELLLMENAARAVVEVLQERYADLREKFIVVLAGNGNNGGDALAIARHLHNLGCSIQVFFLTEKAFSPSAQKNMDMLKRVHIETYSLENEHSLEILKTVLSRADMVLDGLFGTGINRALSVMAQKVIGIVNEQNCEKIAIDIPSGLHCDSGRIMGACFLAQLTITLQLPKQGFYLNEGPSVCGEIRVVNINIPKEAVEFVQPRLKIIDSSVLCFKNRPRQSHKGDYGHLLTIGGAVGTGGAVVLCTKAALRCGCGLVSAVVAKDIYPWVASCMPQAMVHPLGEGSFLEHHENDLKYYLNGKTAVAIGCGMGINEKTEALLKEILSVSIPLVIDADGLNIIAKTENICFGEGVRILTPHPKEMARLCNKTVQEVQENRLQTAQEYAVTHGVWVVLKGNSTVIASPEGSLWLNTTDSPALAKAGSGDVLCGIIGALLAQGYTAEEACTMGVYLHGAAGVLLEHTIGAIACNAEDIINVLDKVIRGEKE